MTGLLDIFPISEKIEVNGKSVEVYGISVGGLATLLGRFPKLMDLFNGGGIDVAEVLPLGDEIIAAIIAAGCGQLGIEAAERNARRLPIGTQVDFLALIIRQTMPDGVDPLAEKLAGIAKALAMRSVNEPNGKAASEPAPLSPPTSPPESSPLYPTDIGKPTYAHIPREGSLHTWKSPDGV